MRGFKNFLMQGDLIIIAVGLVIALAFSTLIKAFTDNIITPLVNAAGGGGKTGLGVHVNGQLLNFGAFVSAVIYFIIFMAVIYLFARPLVILMGRSDFFVDTPFFGIARGLGPLHAHKAAVAGEAR